MCVILSSISGGVFVVFVFALMATLTQKNRYVSTTSLQIYPLTKLPVIYHIIRNKCVSSKSVERDLPER